jgi:hypothetical protein
MERAVFIVHYPVARAVRLGHPEMRGRLASDKLNSVLKHEIHVLGRAHWHKQRITISTTVNHSDLHRLKSP